MKKISYIILFALLISTAQQLKSQQDEPQEKHPKLAIMLVPQYAWVKTFRMDFEIKVGNNAIGIGPHYQYSNESIWFSSSYFDELTAIGANVYFKYNLRKGEYKTNPYMSFGANYTHSNMIASDEVWRPYDYNGYETITYTDETKKILIDKIGPDILFGVAFHPIPEMIIDLSAGIGTRFSFSDENSDMIRDEFGDGILEPGYSGILPVIAFKIGLRI